MSIHEEHPFEVPSSQKSDIRRLRARLPQPVVLACSGAQRQRVGLTVSSITIVEGEDSYAVIWLDPDSDLADTLGISPTIAISVLETGDQQLAETFAGLAPAPGGMFTLGDWEQTPFGPILAKHSWFAGTVVSTRELGWSREITIAIKEVRISDSKALTHLRGKYA